MSGNYGGNSLPTTPISGADITAAKYNQYKCTSAFATVATGAFNYGGVTFTFTNAGESVDLVMDASGISGTDADIIFLCYDCSCTYPLGTGATASSPAYSGTPQMFKPIIIGGGGLNS